MTKEEAAVKCAYRITDYIGSIISKGEFDEFHDKYLLDSDYVRDYIVQGFLEGVEWRDKNPIKSSVDIGFEQMFEADDYEPTIKHFRDY